MVWEKRNDWISTTVLTNQPRKPDYFETKKHLQLIGSDRFHRTSIAGNSKVFGLGALESVHGVAESKRTESYIQYFDRQEPAGKQNNYLVVLFASLKIYLKKLSSRILASRCT